MLASIRIIRLPLNALKFPAYLAGAPTFYFLACYFALLFASAFLYIVGKYAICKLVG